MPGEVLEVREGVLDLLEFVPETSVKFLPIDGFILLQLVPELFLEGFFGIEL